MTALNGTKLFNVRKEAVTTDKARLQSAESTGDGGSPVAVND